MAVNLHEFQLSHLDSNGDNMEVQAFPGLDSLVFHNINPEHRVSVIANHNAVEFLYKALGRWIESGKLGEPPLTYTGPLGSVDWAKVEELTKEINHGG